MEVGISISNKELHLESGALTVHFLQQIKFPGNFEGDIKSQNMRQPFNVSICIFLVSKNERIFLRSSMLQILNLIIILIANGASFMFSSFSRVNRIDNFICLHIHWHWHWISSLLSVLD